MRTLTYSRPWDITVDTRPDARPVGEAPAVLEALIDARVDMDEGPDAFIGLARGLQASKVLVFPQGGPSG